jgi:hypothetical protein
MTVFDLIIVQDLRNQIEKCKWVKTSQYKKLIAQIKQKCDCKFPDDTSTRKQTFFTEQLRLGPVCQFCGKSDYKSL